MPDACKSAVLEAKSDIPSGAIPVQNLLLRFHFCNPSEKCHMLVLWKCDFYIIIIMNYS